MKLLGVPLTEGERALIMTNSTSSVRNRSIALMLDLAIMGFILGSVHNELLVNAWVGFYAGMIAIMVFATLKYCADLNDVQGISETHLNSLLSSSNPALDWPFGPLSMLGSIKNLALLVLAGYIFMQGYVVLGSTILIGLGINVVMILTMAKLTRAILTWRAPPAPAPV